MKIRSKMKIPTTLDLTVLNGLSSEQQKTIKGGGDSIIIEDMTET